MSLTREEKAKIIYNLIESLSKAWDVSILEVVELFQGCTNTCVVFAHQEKLKREKSEDITGVKKELR